MRAEPSARATPLLLVAATERSHLTAQFVSRRVELLPLPTRVLRAVGQQISERYSAGVARPHFASWSLKRTLLTPQAKPRAALSCGTNT